MEKTTIDTRQEIAAGQQLASNIKNYFYPDTPWTPKLAWEIGVKIRDIKNAAKKFYTTKNILEILEELKKFGKRDLEEFLEI